MKKYDTFKIIKEVIIETENIQEFKEELLVDIKSASLKIVEGNYINNRGSVAFIPPLKGKAVYLNGAYNWYLVKRNACVYLVPTKRK